jgi:hypothetical protein
MLCVMKKLRARYFGRTLLRGDSDQQNWIIRRSRHAIIQQNIRHIITCNWFFRRGYNGLDKKQQITLRNTLNSKEVSVEATIDTGAKLLVVSRKLANDLGLTKYGSREVKLPNNGCVYIPCALRFNSD